MPVEVTILLAGVVGVGKTTIFKRIETGEFVQSPSPALNSKSDHEMEHFIYTDTIDGKDYKVNLWDTGGLERYNSMTASYYRYCHAVILVYNSLPERMDSLFALKQWVDEAKKSSFIGDRVIFSLWDNYNSNNSSSNHPLSDHCTPTELCPEVKAFLETHSIPESLHFTVSALTGDNIIESLRSFLIHISEVLTDIRSASITLSDPDSNNDLIPNSDRDNTHEPWHKRICGGKC